MNYIPAFPISHPEMTIAGQSIEETQGMTLRDYFAAKVLPRFMTKGRDRNPILSPLEAAVKSYEIADAMMEARK